MFKNSVEANNFFENALVVLEFLILLPKICV